MARKYKRVEQDIESRMSWHEFDKRLTKGMAKMGIVYSRRDAIQSQHDLAHKIGASKDREDLAVNGYLEAKRLSDWEKAITGRRLTLEEFFLFRN